MSGDDTDVGEIIENHIHVWDEVPALRPLARILENDRCVLAGKLAALQRRGNRSPGDAFRSFLLCYALERSGGRIDSGHFVLFKETETVEAILEDSFGVNPGIDHDEITVPYQDQAFRIILNCVFGMRLKPRFAKDVAAFMHLFSRIDSRMFPDQDRMMRYKTIVWFVYLAITVATVDGRAAAGGVEYLTKKFQDLLECVIKNEIIDEETGKPGYEGGKWEKTLFGWLQGEDRLPFLLKLKRLFNFENRLEHANRGLLAQHRRCIFEQVHAHFCRDRAR